MISKIDLFSCFIFLNVGYIFAGGLKRLLYQSRLLAGISQRPLDAFLFPLDVLLGLLCRYYFTWIGVPFFEQSVFLLENLDVTILFL